MKERELFLAALEIEDPAARQAHLKTECADDAALLARVESLLASHEGQSQFLNTPVVEQIADGSDAGAAATLLFGNGSTRDEELDATDISFHGIEVMTEHRDDSTDEIPLGYLQPSTKPGSIGRLGHYEIHEVLGRGAFGTVLKAFDEKLHRVVAIKVLAPEIAATSPARRRFLCEAQASAAIRHEHVVSIYAVEESPTPYLVMEYIPGLTLQQRLDERGPLDVSTVLRLGRQIAEGLAGAHAQELIHRDIKPGNILLETSVHDRVKITDFGLARAADDASLTQSGTIAGTPMYMAPEQAQGLKLDQRADLFSFGSVMYQMVSGRPPFRANGTLAVLKRVTEDTPRPIREIIPETPQWLCDIITKLHAKNPDERYQSAREIADVLANCEAQLKAHSGLKDFSLIPRAKRQPWYQNLKVKIGGGATAVLLLLAAIFLFQTPHGTLRVEILDPEVEMKVKGTELTFHGTNLDPVSLKTGEKKLLVTRGDLVFETDSFTLKKGAETRVKVELLGDSLVVSNGDQVIAERQIQRKGITSSTTGNDTVASTPQTSNTAAPPPAIAPFDAKQARAHQEAWAKHLGVPVVYTNSLGMKFVLIPPGEFTMGSTLAEIEAALKVVYPTATHWHECIRSEAPQHKVILTQPTYLGVHEVTQAEYEKVMGTNPSHFAPNGTGKEAVAGIDTSNHPIEKVSWNDAAKFCAKLSQQEQLKPSSLRDGAAMTRPDGTGYRLPSEAEWEFACRAGTTTKYWIGDKDEDLKRAGWFGANSGERTHAAGELKANPFGLFDIHGNVWEWVQDVRVPGFYGEFAEKPAINPSSPSSSDAERVVRGGRWYHSASYCRSSVRLSVAPTDRFDDLGFRVSLSVAAVKAAIASSNTIASAPSTATPSSIAPFVEADIKRIAALPAAEQIEEVRKELKKRNPGFDGKAEHKIEAGVVTELKLITDEIIDIAPVRALQGLVSLKLSATPLPGRRGKLSDISPLRGLPLTDLDLGCTEVTNIEVVREMPLKDLSLDRVPVSDLSPLTGKVLKSLHFGGTKVKSLSEVPIAGSEVIHCHLPQISDKAELQRWGVRFLDLWGVPTTVDPERLRELKPPLSRVNGKPLEEFLKEVGQAKAGLPPFTDADVQRIAALPAAGQVEAVRKELMRLNPKFDGKLEHKIEGDVVTELSVNTDEVVNLAPVRALAGLIYFDCRGTYPNQGKLFDLSPLKGMTLRRLDCSSTQVADLTPLTGLPLTVLHFNHNPVSDLSPLKGMPLDNLGCAETKVSDLSPLKGMKLKTLGAQLLSVTDLSPLQGMPLTGLDLYHTIGVTDLTPLKGMPLEGLNLQDLPVSDLSPLQGMTSLRTLLLMGNKVSDLTPLQGLKLTDLLLRDKQITDLSPLKGLPLVRLIIHGFGVSDLTPLQGMPLLEVRLVPKNITQGLDILRDIKSLKTIGIDDNQAWPAAEFWERYDKGEFTK